MTFSTTSRPALRAAACGGRPRPAAPRLLLGKNLGGWRGLSHPETHFHDLGVGFYDTRIGPERAKRNHIRQLEPLGYEVTLEPAA